MKILVDIVDIALLYVDIMHLEVEPAELVHDEDVAGPEEPVAAAPHVTDDLLVAGGAVRVAVVVSHWIVRDVDAELNIRGKYVCVPYFLAF